MHRPSLPHRLLICALAVAQLLALPVSAVLDGRLLAADAALQAAAPEGVVATHVQAAHSANCALCQLLSSASDLLPVRGAPAPPEPFATVHAVRPAEPSAAPAFHPARPRGPPTLLS